MPGRLKDADEIWHLGDVCERETLVEFELLGKPLHVVLGNNDWNAAWPLALELEREGFKFYLTHIPPRNAPKGVAAILHGHTHVPRDELSAGARWLNPAAARVSSELRVAHAGARAWVAVEGDAAVSEKILTTD